MKSSSRTPRAPKSPFDRNRAQREKPKREDNKRTHADYSETQRTDSRPFAGSSQRKKQKPAPERSEQTTGRERQRQENRGRDMRGREGRGRKVRSHEDRPREVRLQEEHREAPSHEGLIVSRRAATRLRTGNPWVYRSDLVSANGVNSGALAPVVDERGKALGTALYSSASQIALRMISGGRVESEAELLSIIRDRLCSAIQYRERVVEDSNAYRLVFSEADFLPGLIVDRYNDVLTMQVLTQAMDRSEIREAVTAELVEQIAPAGIIERVEPRIRDLEQLPPRESALLHGERSSTTFNMNGLTFQFDALVGQKTGAFLDQRENYVAAARYAHGDALDVFCYQGGFALHLARVCDQVTGVDSSRPALETAEQNAIANREAFGGLEIEWIEANAFDLLRDYADTGRQYDTIVVDPPAFAKSKKMLETAMRGYKELNLRALKMLRPGGVLVTCSCSFHVSETDFMQMLAEAAADAHRSLRILEKRGAAKDHPALLAFPESQYLKCVIAIAH